MKKKIAVFIFLVLIAGSLYALYRYYEFESHYSSSNAVFVKSDTLTFLSFKLPGKIEKIYVNEGDEVKKGELLAKLDTNDLELKKKALNFQILSLQNKIKSMVLQKEKLQNDIGNTLKINKNDLAKLQKAIEAKKFAIDAKTYRLDKLKKDYERFKKLYLSKKISREKYENVKVAYFALKNEINAERQLLEGMKYDADSLKVKEKIIKNSIKEVKRLNQAVLGAQKELKAMRENLALVEQNIKDSFLYSPINGEVAKKFVNSDEVVDAGTRVLSVVNPKDVYVLDLLEETKLKGIATGCKATVHIDALDKDFEGYVSKILPASAATFALVPRDISSGEFTKLAQRFYVRIRFEKTPKNVLVGMSGEVVIKRCKK